MWLQVINKVKVIHQGQGHIKVKVKYLHPFKFHVARALCKRVVCIRLKCYLLKLHAQIHAPIVSDNLSNVILKAHVHLKWT